jgi:hypothetical protein
MKHLEGIDSIVVAAFIGGFVLFVLNTVNKVSDDNFTVVGYGAATGAIVQLALRASGVS